MIAPRTQTRVTKTVAASVPPTLWDPVIRLSHWGIALAVLLNGLITGGGSTAHVAIGWAAMSLLLMRLVWGGLGPKAARFSAFPPDLAAAFSHLRVLLTGGTPREYPSHNPAGALMIYSFWIALSLVIATGLAMTGGATPMQVAADNAAVASGDWSALIREEGEDDGESRFGDVAEEVHEVAANLLLVLAALHVAGVVFESRRMHRNLLAPMLLGEKAKRKR